LASKAIGWASSRDICMGGVKNDAVKERERFNTILLSIKNGNTSALNDMLEMAQSGYYLAVMFLEELQKAQEEEQMRLEMEKRRRIRGRQGKGRRKRPSREPHDDDDDDDDDADDDEDDDAEQIELRSLLLKAEQFNRQYDPCHRMERVCPPMIEYYPPPHYHPSSDYHPYQGMRAPSAGDYPPASFRSRQSMYPPSFSRSSQDMHPPSRYQPSREEVENKILMMMGLDFSREECSRALRANNYDMKRATDQILAERSRAERHDDLRSDPPVRETGATAHELMPVDQKLLNEMEEMGFSRRDSISALLRSENNLTYAVDILCRERRMC